MSAIEKLKLDKEKLLKISEEYSATQQQTKETFGFEWSNDDLSFTDAVKDLRTKWIRERYLDNDDSYLEKILDGNGKVIMEVGCGSGISGALLFGDKLNCNDYLGVDISDSIDFAEKRFKELGYTGDFIKCDLMNIPIPDNSIDIILAEGVLHHTDSTQKAIESLSKKLKPNGRLMFYVYAKKSLIREFTDDKIREHLTDMSNQEAFDALKPLTKLGAELGKLNLEIDVPDNIPYLGIKKGKIDLQRLFYWNFFKAFYDSKMTIDEMNLINFDWYRPLNCHRHTKEEVIDYCESQGLEIEKLHIHTAGITVIAQKKQ